MRRALALLALSACQTYDPPPAIESATIEKDLYDPAAGALAITFTEPIVTDSLHFALRIDRRAPEGDICVKDGESLPEGCKEEATIVVGACDTADLSGATRVGDDGGLKIPCQNGGSYVIDGAHTRIEFAPESRLIPYERYLLVFESGLTDEGGATTGVPLKLGFQVKSGVPLAPTDFATGMFFAVFDIEKPISAQFQFYFWFEVNAATGEIQFFGTDIDPKDDTVDPKTDRDPAHWVLDPNPPKGVTLSAKGQISDTNDGRLLLAYPFLLSIAIPRVEARGVELNARFEKKEQEGAPAGERDVAIGSMYSPSVVLGLTGEPANLGEGRGRVLFFRLKDSEAPPLEALFPTGKTKADFFN